MMGIIALWCTVSILLVSLIFVLYRAWEFSNEIDRLRDKVNEYEYDLGSEQERKMNESSLRASRAQDEVQNLRRQLHEREIEEAYEKGLHDGRTTDELYRQFLSKVSRDKQATVMMKGETEDE